jgi:hypothetical protein
VSLFFLGREKNGGGVDKHRTYQEDIFLIGELHQDCDHIFLFQKVSAARTRSSRRDWDARWETWDPLVFPLRNLWPLNISLCLLSPQTESNARVRLHPWTCAAREENAVEEGKGVKAEVDFFAVSEEWISSFAGGREDG